MTMTNIGTILSALRKGIIVTEASQVPGVRNKEGTDGKKMGISFGSMYTRSISWRTRIRHVIMSEVLVSVVARCQHAHVPQEASGTAKATVMATATRMAHSDTHETPRQSGLPPTSCQTHCPRFPSRRCGHCRWARASSDWCAGSAPASRVRTHWLANVWTSYAMGASPRTVR